MDIGGLAGCSRGGYAVRIYVFVAGDIVDHVADTTIEYVRVSPITALMYECWYWC